MKLYLIRHGESEANAGNIHQGQLDSALSELGEMQARKVGERFKDTNDFDVIYSSDLQRALNTAKEIHKHHPKTSLIIDKRIRERDHGIFTGEDKGKKLYDTLEGENDCSKTPPNGENMHDLQDRVNLFLDEIIKKNQNAIIVSHGGAMKGMIRKLTNAPFKLFWTCPIDNTGIFEVEIKDGEVTFIKENCVKHLFE